MKLQSIFVYTHDSIFLGEDGPTHQPIGELASLRAIPGLTVLRPADANETAEAWRVAVEHRHGPVAFALIRQNLPILDETAEKAREGVPRGGYILSDPAEGEPEIILIATGSEVWLALEAAKQLTAKGRRVRVVSMPSCELFDAAAGRLQGIRPAPTRSASASPSKPPPPSAGTSTSASTATSTASSASARRRPTRIFRRRSGSCRRMW